MGNLSALKITLMPLGELTPDPRNARTHTDKQIELIAKSLDEFGFINPIIIDEAGNILVGHARHAAAKRRGMKEVPTIQVSHMSGAQKRAYIIADNRLAELAGWDFDILGEELGLLLDEDINLDLEAIGFDASEIDHIVLRSQEETEESQPEEPPVELPGNEPAVSEVGDLWQIGPHRLLCANALEPESYTRLLASETAQMVFTDPPYNVPIAGHVSGLGKAKHREFAMASGEMSRTEFTAFLRTVMTLMARSSANGSIHFICMDWRHAGEMEEAGCAVYSELKNICVWAKANAGLGTFYRSQHEFVFVWKVGTAKHINNFGLGEKGRYRTNLWTYAGANTFRKGRDEDLADHPTVKPVKMVEDAILDCSKPKGIILDPFAGVGTTLVAAHRAKRRGYGIELDPGYVDCALRRLGKEMNAEPRLSATGESFEEVAARRLQGKEAA
ncbi:DNA modification methylase [Altererythrobacter xiamenensis]|uniref:Methyltransferase n=1 Tax=Altererythrobacter xiamenensis TaxID=1316679 RepID=A0A1Y6EPY2_9SPHN|nr:DNA methyltransferase [Altererythrobacter xiamenensis]SMQ64396.1 DNA modification methylase [Altererythrobacter xiamenensis]